MEIVVGFLSIFLAIPGVYYAREQFLSQRRDRVPIGQHDTTVLTPGRPSTLERIRETRHLRVGCLWYPPFVEYKRDNGSITASGYYPDILAALAESMNTHVSFTVLRWHEAIDAIEKGEVDVVACVLKSAERRARCGFAGTVFRVGVGGVVRSAQTKIQNQGDLARHDVSIAVTKGEIGWTYAIENLELATQPARFTVLEDKSIQTMMTLVEKGTVDCALADSLSCAQFIQSCSIETPLVDVFTKAPIYVEDNSLMIAKNDPVLREWLEAGIREMRTRPEIKQHELAIEENYAAVLHRAVPRL